jgi:hypothetical protein
LRFGLTMLEEEDDEDERRRYSDGMERDMQELEELITASMEYAKLNRAKPSCNASRWICTNGLTT